MNKNHGAKVLPLYNSGARSIILPIKSTTLSKEEHDLFKRCNPLGFIFFSRNFESRVQLSNLIQSLKRCLERDEVLFLIDQEGGRVKRVLAPDFTEMPTAATYGELAQKDLEGAAARLAHDFAVVGRELRTVGIQVNCAPVADLRYFASEAVIGDRSYGDNVKIVVRLAQAAIQGLSSSGVTAVIKHIPGHGRAVDSHKELPVVNTSLQELERTDFAVFRLLKDTANIAMTAHVIYKELDPYLPVTLSKIGIDYIRNKIGFRGIIISDSLDMTAVHEVIEKIPIPSSTDKLSYLSRTTINAGCDIVLYSNPDTGEMEKTAMSTPCIEKDSRVLRILHSIFARC